MKKLQDILALLFFLLEKFEVKAVSLLSPSLQKFTGRMSCIIAVFLCATLLFGCQYNVFGTNKRNIPVSKDYIPPKQSKQQYEEPKSSESEFSGGVKAPQAPVKIALLVPLSGNYKDLGKSMLNAAELALFKIGDPNLTILPIDTKDSAYGATQAAKDAVEQGAKIILGPVFSNSAKAVAKVAEENNIQVVSFSNDKSLAGTGVFAIGLMPEQQVRRIVNFAMEKGIKDFVTLLPSDNSGTAVTKELQQIMAGNRGAAIVKNEVYQADNQGRIISLEEHVKTVFDAANSNTSTTPRAILIPASASATGQIFGIMAKNNYDRSKVQLLGNEQWNEASLLANPMMEGAWFTALPSERRRDFENKFKEIYGYEAPKITGLAYDGIALAATLAKIPNGEGFSRQSLTNPRGFIGVDGIFRLQENGLCERGFAVMYVKGGNAIVIDPAPTSFSGL